MIHQKPTFRDGAVHKDRWLYVCECDEKFESENALRWHRRSNCRLNRQLPDFFGNIAKNKEVEIHDV